MESIKKVKTAVIGIGNMGRHHVRNYFEIEASELVAFADLNETLGKEMAVKYNCKYYSDYLQMIEKEEIDVLTIAVPSKFHYKVGMDVLNKKVNVLIEKPIAMTEEEAKELIACAKKNDVKLMIGHIERFNPGVVKLKEIINEGKLGKITSIIARRVGIFPPQIKDANVLVDLGVHDIDIINYLLGKEPDRVTCNGGKALLDSREDYAEIFLNYGETSGFVQVNWITPVKIRNLAVTGDSGYAELNYLTQNLKVYKSNYEKTFDDFGEFMIKFAEPESTDIEVAEREPLKAEIESFIESVIKNKPVMTSGEDGLTALKIALKAEKDLKNARVNDTSNRRG